MRLVMMGTGSFAEPTLEALLAKPPSGGRPGDAAGPRHRQGTRLHAPSAARHERARPGTRYSRLSARKHQHTGRRRATGQWQPDLLVVAAYGQILSKDVLAAAPKGGINVHASLLPKYRGAAPIAWAIYNGETETGVTIIRMSIALDAGDLAGARSRFRSGRMKRPANWKRGWRRWAPA